MKKRINPTSGILLTGLFLSALLFSCQSKTSSTDETVQSAKSTTPSIVGSWEITKQDFTSKDTSKTSTPFRSIITFTDKFYSMTIATEDRPSWPETPKGEKVTYDNLANAFNHFISNAGRYEIKGDSIMYNIIAAKSPNFMNDTKKYAQAFSFDGDKLITNVTYSNGAKITYTYSRLE
jgi:hypothetical protein